MKFLANLIATILLVVGGALVNLSGENDDVSGTGRFQACPYWRSEPGIIAEDVTDIHRSRTIRCAPLSLAAKSRNVPVRGFVSISPPAQERRSAAAYLKIYRLELTLLI